MIRRRRRDDEDESSEYAQDERDLYDAGLRLARLPGGGWAWVRRYPTPEDHP